MENVAYSPFCHTYQSSESVIFGGRWLAYRLLGAPIGFGDALQSLIVHDCRERLTAIEMPTLIVWGLSDRVIPVAAAASYHRRIPHSRLEIFERTGHVPQLERPLRFNALLDEFLARDGTVGG